MLYQFYVYVDEGEDSWIWDLEDYNKVKKDIQDNKHDEFFSVELRKVKSCFDIDDIEYIEIYPENNSNGLPKYVKKYIDKALAI